MIVSGSIPLAFSWEPETTPAILALTDEQVNIAFKGVLGVMTPCRLISIHYTDAMPAKLDTVSFIIDGIPPIRVDEPPFCLSKLRLRIVVADRQSDKRQYLRITLCIKVVVTDARISVS